MTNASQSNQFFDYLIKESKRVNVYCYTKDGETGCIEWHDDFGILLHCDYSRRCFIPKSSIEKINVFSS